LCLWWLYINDGRLVIEDFNLKKIEPFFYLLIIKESLVGNLFPAINYVWLYYNIYSTCTYLRWWRCTKCTLLLPWKALQTWLLISWGFNYWRYIYQTICPVNPSPSQICTSTIYIIIQSYIINCWKKVPNQTFFDD
jgi:hypothetical protein